MATPSFMKGKYTKSKDEKMDKAHGKKKKPKTIAEDRKKDDSIIKSIKLAEKKHEAKEGKKGEKAEDKREKKKK